MTTDDKIRYEKLLYDINREAAKKSALTSGKIDQYVYRAGEEILLSDQKRVIEQAKFAYSPLGRVLKNKQKQLKIKAKSKQKQLNIMENNCFNLMKLLKKIFISQR